ncbi:hypothetical protein [Mycobacterium sp.]|uniref:hypothetical protein n=1 Tax=Mycobacterium sp. TaxID=1785 RepID=UPI001273809D|nr:hypothetical protein [Mycobacterium sp.]KAA8964545.1 MAG: hypothetical protein F6Q13_09715 [Mycobacterium sp.]
MAQPQIPSTSSPDEAAQSLPGRRVRVAGWDAICTVATLTVLVVVVTATNWPSRLFGFLAGVCAGEDCAPVPFGVDIWIYPVVWGGVGAGVAAAVIGPIVSLVKGWHLYFWPILAVAVVLLSAVAGWVITAFSDRYWH